MCVDYGSLLSIPVLVGRRLWLVIDYGCHSIGKHTRFGQALTMAVILISIYAVKLTKHEFCHLEKKNGKEEVSFLYVITYDCISQMGRFYRHFH